MSDRTPEERAIAKLRSIRVAAPSNDLTPVEARALLARLDGPVESRKPEHVGFLGPDWRVEIERRGYTRMFSKARVSAYGGPEAAGAIPVYIGSPAPSERSEAPDSRASRAETVTVRSRSGEEALAELEEEIEAVEARQKALKGTTAPAIYAEWQETPRRLRLALALARKGAEAMERGPVRMLGFRIILDDTLPKNVIRLMTHPDSAIELHVTEADDGG